MMTEIKYLSTRGQEFNLNFEDVLLSGLARDGGSDQILGQDFLI